jgi:hypothetical protein
MASNHVRYDVTIHAGSILDEVIGFVNLPNSASRTVVLGSSQPITEMSTRNLSGAKGRPTQPHRHLWADCLESVALQGLLYGWLLLTFQPHGTTCSYYRYKCRVSVMLYLRTLFCARMKFWPVQLSCVYC